MVRGPQAILGARDAVGQATYGISATTILTGFRRLTGLDYPDPGRVREFVARVRGTAPGAA
ncbi:hypothetical protein B7R22_12880 [Subtercola boreus]|uniref:Uncharacterized protein n=1 Tax=Subtercola boreus TaxID=120213 RepID=A0A3E0VUW7_9MICO|nr:hypothetical protein [Subtercola boreus]RFA13551.1 hypothetical protein B7R22_12880 [Subtercola boreus]